MTAEILRPDEVPRAFLRRSFGWADKTLMDKESRGVAVRVSRSTWDLKGTIANVVRELEERSAAAKAANVLNFDDARKKRAEIEKLELQIAEKRGELLAFAGVQARTGEVLAMHSAELDSIGSRLAGRLIAMSEAEAAAAVQLAIREARDRLASRLSEAAGV